MTDYPNNTMDTSSNEGDEEWGPDDMNSSNEGGNLDSEQDFSSEEEEGDNLSPGDPIPSHENNDGYEPEGPPVFDDDYGDDFDPEDPWVQWDYFDLMPEKFQRVVRETALCLDYNDIPFHGKCLHTNILAPNYNYFIDDTGMRTVGCRQYSKHVKEYQFVWTQPDTEEAMENSLLKDHCWIFFSKTVRRYTVSLSLGLVHDESDPCKGGVKLLLDVIVTREDGGRTQEVSHTSTVNTEGQWDEFYKSILVPTIGSYCDATGRNDNDSGHTTPDHPENNSPADE